MHTEFWSGNLKERDHAENLDVGGRILEFVLEKWGEKVSTEFFWFRIETSGGLL
jgi:hypothetical protein